MTTPALPSVGLVGRPRPRLACCRDVQCPFDKLRHQAIAQDLQATHNVTGDMVPHLTTAQVLSLGATSRSDRRALRLAAANEGGGDAFTRDTSAFSCYVPTTLETVLPSAFPVTTALPPDLRTRGGYSPGRSNPGHAAICAFPGTSGNGLTLTSRMPAMSIPGMRGY